MDGKSIFNATICLLGIAIFLIHTVDLALKKEKRQDDWNLLSFFLFTAIHFATYLTFTLIKVHYTSNSFIMGAYTVFYIMNNIELALLFAYTIAYIGPKPKVTQVLSIIHYSLFTLFIMLDVVNVFTHMFFSASSGVYVRAPTMFLSQGYQFVALAMVFFLAFTDKKLRRTEKIAFFLYCVLPFAAIILQNLLPGYAFGYLSILVSIEILFLFTSVRKNAELANEARRTKEAEINVMVSQIRPHFIYNTLSSISTLITIDPDKASKALDDFTEYLRRNLSFLSDSRSVTFAAELKHIQTYISLEQMRFEGRLHVIYDIADDDFFVPPLSIQPLVENAVKHGILRKLEGGTVTLKTYREGNDHIIIITDDGVGFDVSKLKDNDPDHIGIGNVKYRLSSLAHGSMDIISERGKGTTVIVRIGGQ